MKSIHVLFAFAMTWAAAATAAGSSSDAEFVKKAAAAGMAEVAVGRLAVSNGQSADIKQFGQRMVDDHSKANDDLKAAAAKDNIDLPSAPTKEQQAAADKLGKLNGAAFDKEYARMMVKDHEEAVALFKKEAASGSSSNVKAFAQKALPTLEEHLTMAKDLGKPGAKSM